MFIEPLSGLKVSTLNAAWVVPSRGVDEKASLAQQFPSLLLSALMVVDTECSGAWECKKTDRKRCGFMRF